MSSSSANQFWLGFATALSAVWIWQQLQQQRQHGKEETIREKNVPLPSTTTNTTQNKVMDTPDLDQRILRKAEAVLQWRTSRVIVVVERCTNDHNYSAILRTVEALGLQNVWLIDPPPPPTLLEDKDGNLTTQVEVAADSNAGRPKEVSANELKQRALHHLFAQNATEWLDVREFASTEACLLALQQQDYQVWVTDLGQEAVCLTTEELPNFSVDNNNYKLPTKLAIVFGTEAVGCSAQMLQAADLRVYLPLRGFADSLNLSVATALIIQQLFHLDSSIVGDMPVDERHALRRQWYTKLFQQRLLTAKQKKTRAKLQVNIQQCHKIKAKQEQLELLQQKEQSTNTPQNPNQKKKLQPLTQSELDKLAQLPKFQQQLQELEEVTRLSGPGAVAVQQAIENAVNNPPLPLSDMRRADEHRGCYVGKNTKNKNQEHWQNLATTHRYDTTTVQNASRNYFRNQVEQQATSNTNGSTNNYNAPGTE